MSQATLLYVFALINAALGFLLVYFPRPVVHFLGLPYTAPRLYARILGGVLFGIGLALIIEAATGDGLGLTGAIAINLSGAAVLAGCMVFLRLRLPRHGQVTVWLAVAALLALSWFALMADPV